LNAIAGTRQFRALANALRQDDVILNCLSLF